MEKEAETDHHLPEVTLPSYVRTYVRTYVGVALNFCNFFGQATSGTGKASLVPLIPGPREHPVVNQLQIFGPERLPSSPL